MVICPVLVGLVAFASPAAARDKAYSPSGTFVVDPGDVPFALSDAGFRCPRVVALPAPAPAKTALKNAQTELAKLAGKHALAVFAKSKAYQHADLIPASVVTALATGRPTAALAASLRGAVLEPKQPRHLVNAAVVLIGFGDLRDANGLLTAAGKLKGTGAALGLTEAQALNAAKAELAIASGHFAKAESMYRVLVRQATDVLALEEGLSQSLACQHKATPAAARRVRGERQMFDYVADGDPGGDGVPPEVDAGSVDETAGKDIASFGNYYHPRNQDDATSHLPALHAASAAAAATANALGQINPQSPALAGRRYELYAQLVLTADKELARLQAQRDQIERDRHALDPPGGDVGTPPCYYSQHHAAEWDIVDRFFSTATLQARRFHKLATALAAGVSDPVANHDLNQQAAYFVATMYEAALESAESISSLEAVENVKPLCRVDAGQDGPGAGTETPADPGPGSDPCSAAKIERLKIKLGSAVSAEFSCEGGKVEVVPAKWGVEQAYIGAFVEAGVKWKSGDVTAVSGVKVSVGTKDTPGLPEVGIAGKAGFYVTAGRDKTKLATYGDTKAGWTVKDWGVRLQGTAEVPGSKAGAFTTITKFDSKTDISLVGVFN
ncbi:MAG: hypothetical protein QOJ11_3850 [Frankiales bacterium]|jgi:hypothetical protein|nr:hypothetical protein [Frankiales bacterium]